MAVHTEVPPEYREMRERDLKERGITPEEGANVFSRILSKNTLPQIVVNTRSLSLEFKPGGLKATAKLEELAGKPEGRQTPTSRHSRPNLQNPYAPPTTSAEKQICGIWQEMLGIEQVGAHDNFFELGGTSLTAIHVISRINRELNSELHVANLYEGLTVNHLAGLIGSAESAQEPAVEQVNQADDRRERMIQRKQYQQKRRVLMER